MGGGAFSTIGKENISAEETCQNSWTMKVSFQHKKETTHPAWTGPPREQYVAE